MKKKITADGKKIGLIGKKMGELSMSMNQIMFFSCKMKMCLTSGYGWSGYSLV
jgi:hypothetical protein